MDHCTLEVRKQYWADIIQRCMNRPKGMTAKQWLDENGICEQTYYTWLRRFRKESFELSVQNCTETVATTSANEVTFAEIPIPAMKSFHVPDSFHPDAVIHTGQFIIDISNTATKKLLGDLIEVINHAV